MSAYNSSDSIERAIASILNQTFTDFELIILNDGSTDDTEEKVLSFEDERINYFSLDHAGLPTALNFGVSQARSEIIARHDSDDWSEPTRLAQQFEQLFENDDIDLVASWHNVVDDSGDLLGMKQIPSDHESLKLMLKRRSPFCHGAIAVRKSSLLKIGGYNPELYFSQDYELWLRMATAGMRFSAIPSPLYNYSITPDSISKGWYKLRRIKTIRSYAETNEQPQRFSLPDIPEISSRRKQGLWNYAVGSLALDDGRRAAAIKSFAKGILSDPLFWRSYFKIVFTAIPLSISSRLVSRFRQ